MLHRDDEHQLGWMASSSTMGAAVSLRSIRKSFGPVVAIDDVSIEIGAGEFLAMLGPSGSGKSTILMSIAGFEAPQSGEILVDDVPITTLPPHRRGIGMVFQRYALFPHLTVAENVAYPLRRRGINRADMEAEVARALRLVNLENYDNRYPAQLSGGQQQRVAVARALVFRPPLLLMDEPLGALDRKLRQQMQMELKLLHKELGTTIVMVTHDQDEALSMADRVALLHHGQLHQVGTPNELYEAPTSAFVAGFIGETNLVPVEVVRRDGTTVLAQATCLREPIAVADDACLATDRQGLLGIRPEDVKVAPSGEGIEGIVVERAYGGAQTTMLIDVRGTMFSARVDSASALEAGLRCVLRLSPANCRIYPVQSRHSHPSG